MSSTLRQHLSEHVDPAGVEGPCSVFFEPASFDDEGRPVPSSICIGGSVDLGLQQAASVARAVLELLDNLLPATEETLRTLRLCLRDVNDRRGTQETIESISEALGLEAPLTEADATRIATHVGLIA